MSSFVTLIIISNINIRRDIAKKEKSFVYQYTTDPVTEKSVWVSEGSTLKKMYLKILRLALNYCSGLLQQVLMQRAGFDFDALSKRPMRFWKPYRSYKLFGELGVSDTLEVSNT